MLGGTWWAVGGEQLAMISLQEVECFVFVNVILVGNVVVVVYIVNDSSSSKYLCYFVMVSTALLFAGE